MDKWERNDIGYRTDWPDGIYEVTHIIYSDSTLKDKQKSGRIVEIKEGKVHVEGKNFPGFTPKNTVSVFCQLEFFEVNIVVEYLKEI
jgi:hypothetical protein